MYGHLKQAGTGPSRRHVQGSKIAERLPSVKYSLLQYSKIEKFSKIFRKNYILKKNGPSGAPGPASASPWRAKVSQCRKTERGDSLGFFNIHSVAKHQKIERGKFIFGKKSHSAEKNCKEGPLGFSNIHSDAKQRKKLKGGDHLGEKIEKKSRSAEKMKGGTLWSRPVWYVTIGTLTSYSRIFDFIYPK